MLSKFTLLLILLIVCSSIIFSQKQLQTANPEQIPTISSATQDGIDLSQTNSLPKGQLFEFKTPLFRNETIKESTFLEGGFDWPL